MDREEWERLSLWERGQYLNFLTGKALAMPAAKFLPGEVKELISLMAATVGSMTREIETLKEKGAGRD